MFSRWRLEVVQSKKGDGKWSSKETEVATEETNKKADSDKLDEVIEDCKHRAPADELEKVTLLELPVAQKRCT